MKATRTLLGMRGITIGRKQRIMKRKSRIVISLVLATFALTFIQSAKADIVTNWNAIATTAAAPVQGVVPQTRTFAMMHAAVHDALNAIDRRYQPCALHLQAQVGASPDAAVATAAHSVLVQVLPPVQQPLRAGGTLTRSLASRQARPRMQALLLGRPQQRRSSLCAVRTVRTRPCPTRREVDLAFGYRPLPGFSPRLYQVGGM